MLAPRVLKRVHVQQVLGTALIQRGCWARAMGVQLGAVALPLIPARVGMGKP